MKPIKIFSVIIVLLSPIFLIAQATKLPKINFDLQSACHYNYTTIPISGNQIQVLDPNRTDIDLFNRILSYTGLTNNFKIYITPEISSACAGMQGNTRVLLVNQEFMNRMNSATHTDWAKQSIIAHELGHHLNNHSFSASTTKENRKKMEIEADRYSGFLLRLMGADQNDVLLGLDQLSTTIRTENPYYPNLQARQQAISLGYSSAEPIINSVSSFSRNSDPSDEFTEKLDFDGVMMVSYMSSNNKTYIAYEREYIMNGTWTTSTNPNYLYEIKSLCGQTFVVNTQRQIIQYWYEKINDVPILRSILVGTLIPYEK